MDGQALFVPKFWNPSVFERGELALFDSSVIGIKLLRPDTPVLFKIAPMTRYQQQRDPGQKDLPHR